MFAIDQYLESHARLFEIKKANERAAKQWEEELAKREAERLQRDAHLEAIMRTL